MDVRIGIVQSMKELDIDLSEDIDVKKLTKEIEGVLADDGVLWLTDRKGRRVGIPAARIAYVEFGGEQPRQMGFGT